MLKYTGTRPFQAAASDDAIRPGDTIDASHPKYEYLKLRGDFVDTAAPPSGSDALPVPAAPAPEPMDDEQTPTAKGQ